MDSLLDILIVEDHDMLREEMVAFLSRSDWRVRGVHCGQALDAALRERLADIVVLDLNLPEEDGISIAQRLRAAMPELGIIMLTARIGQNDRALGYGSGADVYLTKPANIGELESIIYNLSRRMAAGAPRNADNLVLNMSHMLLKSGTQHMLKLTVNEFKVLSRLAVAPERELSADMLLYIISGEQETGFEARQKLTVMLSRLRTKLSQELDEPDLIKAVRSKGYRLSKPVALVD